MESKLKSHALKIAGWGLLYGGFFDLYQVAEALKIPNSQAADLMIYLRTLRRVELVAKTCSKLKEKGKAPKRIFIKVLCIHPDDFMKPQEPKPTKMPKPPKQTKQPRAQRPLKQPKHPTPPKPPKPESLQHKLARLVRIMPSPPVSH
ncbi:hypothetical protein [Aeromonas rivuli]|uniref:hypothetical protein n=1 Tax=Aeromonas rivuli TaxID=648794 RepID=UPI001CCDE286|nr:hypothetical protein [Aeromonas rivuli]UBO74865.1 hypothetical protein KYK33_04730 [Aeromonas rivuli]